MRARANLQPSPRIPLQPDRASCLSPRQAEHDCSLPTSRMDCHKQLLVVPGPSVCCCHAAKLALPCVWVPLAVILKHDPEA